MQNNPKYLIGYLEEDIKPLVLILLKISGCVKTSKDNNNNKWYTIRKIGITKGIALTKSKKSREYIVCYYQCFNHGFEFQKSVCNGYHDLLRMSPHSNIAIMTIKGVDYGFISYSASKSDAIHLL